MCSILPLSIEPIRRKVYEFFLATHFVLALFTIVLLFYHVKVMDGEYDIYLWVCVGVWVSAIEESSPCCVLMCIDTS